MVFVQFDSGAIHGSSSQPSSGKLIVGLWVSEFGRGSVVLDVGGVLEFLELSGGWECDRGRCEQSSQINVWSDEGSWSGWWAWSLWNSNDWLEHGLEEVSFSGSLTVKGSFVGVLEAVIR